MNTENSADPESTNVLDKPDFESLQSIEFKQTNCPICGRDDARLKYSKRIRDMDMTYFICNGCQALYANPHATVDSLRNIYASADFFDGGEPGSDHLNYPSFIGGEKYLRRTARDRLSRIQKYRDHGRMLEVASAAGFFLVEAKALGYDVSGVEFSEPMAKWASERWDVPVISDSIELIELPDDTYDVIASWGVMTIIRDPVALMKKFHRALKPGGLWAFNTYYHDGLWPKIVRQNWNILVINFSQTYTKQMLLDLPAQNGFELLSRRREMPWTDLEKLADQLVFSFRFLKWLPTLLRKLGMSEWIIRIPLPEVHEYIYRKKS